MKSKQTYPFWSPRFWHGMRLGDWLGLLARHRFRVHPLRIPTAAAITGFAAFNSGAARLQQTRFGRRIAAADLVAPPIFIVGHWRSGTTFLHELFMHDERLACPNTYQCFVPSHFLLTERTLTRLTGWVLPKQRPMDNVAAGWRRPQEDEFAICNLGAPSPYLRMAFPNDGPVAEEMLTFDGASAEAIEQWDAAITYFLRAMTLRTGKRLALKSPTHTGRVAHLARIFPGARFVHLVRDPHSLYASTLKLWRTLDDVQGLQKPTHAGLEPYVLSTFERMYAAFERGRQSLGERQLYELRYEDLVADPVAQMEQIYRRLDLGNFDAVRPRIVERMSQQQNYAPNRHQISQEQAAVVRERWAGYAERYGYVL